jgi:hypothetical protein
VTADNGLKEKVDATLNAFSLKVASPLILGGTAGVWLTLKFRPRETRFLP